MTVATNIRRILFRVDANQNIGMGHIMRCLSIADAFKDSGHNARFIIADDRILKFINQRGYEAEVLSSDYQKMEDEKWIQDYQPDLIIVDSYYVTAKYLHSLRKKMKCTGGKLVYIDDVLSFPYPVDILVNYNAYSALSIYDRLYSDSLVEKPQFILGPTYAPLRSMFRNIPKKNQPDTVKNILISTGGSDELHLALSILRAIISSDRVDRVYHFLLGAMNADKETIKKANAEDASIVIHENVTDMKSLIESMDLAISAAGSTLYEISACGVPLITYSLADNQISGAEAFKRLGLAVNVGDLRDTASIDSSRIMSGILDHGAVERIMKATDALADDCEKRYEMGKKMQEMIDGFGANRIVSELLRLMCV